MTAPVDYRRPLPLIAVLGPMLGILSASALVFALGDLVWDWWELAFELTLARWAAFGGIFAIVLSIAGALATRPGSGRRGFGLAILGLVLGLVSAIVPWTLEEENQPPMPITLAPHAARSTQHASQRVPATTPSFSSAQESPRRTHPSAPAAG